MSADEALKLLQDGNARYVEGKPQHPNQTRERRALTAGQGQKPFVSILSCADSRVPPEILFDRGIGDLFIIRVAGNVAGADELGTMEYGVDHLHTPLVVVLGHSLCGAVTAVVEGAKVHGHIASLVQPIAPAAAKAKADNPAAAKEALVQAAIRQNVWQAIEDIFQKSPDIRKAVKAGQVKIVGAVYDIDTGQVQWLGPHPEQAKLAGLKAKEAPAKGAKKAKKAAD
jgi:carbonic anhydrase